MSPSCENQDDGYSTAFLPVVGNARIAIPSHYKHFSVKMFTFITDEKILTDQVKDHVKCIQPAGLLHVCIEKKNSVQIYVHCAALICDANEMEGSCRKQCAYPRDSTSYTPSGGMERKKGECFQLQLL